MRISFFRKRFLASSIVALVPGMAWAQSDPLPTVGQDVSDNAIVVTARSRAEPLQKVPDSVTVISGATIDAAGIQNMSDLSKFAPNFNFTSGFRAGAAEITVRGLTTPQGGELPVAFVVDGVQIPGADFFNQDLIDVAQVQVLQGSQGALYGQGAIAGAILITTRAPTNTLAFDGKASYGNDNTYHLLGSVTGALVPDKLYFRLVGSFRKSDGIIRDDAGNGRDFVDEKLVRGELRFDDGGTFRAALTGEYEHAHDGAIYQDTAPIVNGRYQLDDFNSVGIDSNTIGYERRERIGGSLRLEQDIAGGVLASTTSYNRLNQTSFGDADFGPLNLLTQTDVYNIRLFTQDLRYQSDGSKPVRYIFGAFYQDRSIYEPLQVPFLPDSGISGYAVNTSDTQHSQNWAVFGQVNANITSKMEITAALRYDDNERRFFNNFTDVSLSKKFSKVQPKFSLSYNWTQSLMTYATFAEGFRSGGFNSASSIFAGPIYNAETSRNYELGLKAQFANGKVTFNAAIFRTDLQNGQFFFTSISPPSQNIVNINRSRINGAEAQLSIQPIKALTLQVAGGLTNAVIEDFNGTGLNDGEKSPNVPSSSLRGTASYAIPVTQIYTLTPRVDVFRRGRLYFDTANTLESNPYTNLDLRLTLGSAKWSLAGFVANATNERHAETTSSNNGLRTGNEPRTYGVELAVHFH